MQNNRRFGRDILGRKQTENNQQTTAETNTDTRGHRDTERTSGVAIHQSPALLSLIGDRRALMKGKLHGIR